MFKVLIIDKRVVPSRVKCHFLFISKDIVVISENNLQFARDYLEMEKLVIFKFFCFCYSLIKCFKLL